MPLKEEGTRMTFPQDQPTVRIEQTGGSGFAGHLGCKTQTCPEPAGASVRPEGCHLSLSSLCHFPGEDRGSLKGTTRAQATAAPSSLGAFTESCRWYSCSRKQVLDLLLWPPGEVTHADLSMTSGTELSIKVESQDHEISVNRRNRFKKLDPPHTHT